MFKELIMNSLGLVIFTSSCKVVRDFTQQELAIYNGFAFLGLAI